LNVSVVAGVLRVTIDRPERLNALSLALLGDLERIFGAQASNPELRAAIITGAGNRSFAAGGDLKELAAFRSAPEARAVTDIGRRALDAIRSFPVPVIAAINGTALGGGAELALACDFRVAAPGATVGFLQSRLNITSAWGGASDLVATIGPNRALELLLSARIVDAAEALEIGLLDAVAAEDATLGHAADDFCSRWTSKPGHLIRAIVAPIRVAKDALRAKVSATETTGFLATWTHDDHWAAAVAATGGGSRTN